ncbi:MAG: hypothetical protein L0210_00625 [Rhodospirillales bacterium]|nr:hypothetical protein [Rhodospirillales bacterium]
MIKSLMVACGLCLAGAANAGIPLLNYSCPGNIEVHADQGGPVFINGKEAKLKKSNENYYEATGHGVTVSISINPDKSLDVSYTGKHRAHGVCHKSGQAAGNKSHSPKTTDQDPKATKACLAAVAKKVGVDHSKVSAIEVLTAEAGTLVTVKVPKADAPWSCQYERGKVQGVSFTGSDGG